MERETVTELSKMKELYREDADFKRYVDRYCQSKVLTVGEALQLALVKEVGRYYTAEHLQYAPKEIL